MLRAMFVLCRGCQTVSPSSNAVFLAHELIGVRKGTSSETARQIYPSD